MNVKPHSATGTGKVATTVKLIFDLRAGIAARDETIRSLRRQLADAYGKRNSVRGKFR